MNNLLSKIAVIFSFIALAGSGFAVSRVSQLELSLPSASVSSSVVPDSPPEDSPTAQETDPDESSRNGQSIQLGQFSQVALDGQARVEITAAKRLETAEGSADNMIVLELRYRRLVDTVVGNGYIHLGKAQARNPDTREIYRPIANDKKTAPFFAKTLPTDAWADAFVWLQVPKEIDTVDVVLDKTPVFKGVPISS
ncbi:hypothetical protein C1752_00023 [Acaryochloris thomasi RCC1774]|uniref:Uncharacterized protein n=1 Tax=Acaryochloris thomasi RCC1774 TaxID=1764569 RepID=A0A2W1K1K2_9CYAN|nr:hypothetical protein [Acaryochloris thomasi]PZD75324.1 hypothetical protein C1752_00023 [Acaryochloris thomasi RCC1774]